MKKLQLQLLKGVSLIASRNLTIPSDSRDPEAGQNLENELLV